MSGNILNLKNLRLAVLIDAENVPRTCIKQVMEEIAVYGTPTIKRIYGDWTSPVVAGWKASLLQNAITPIQQYSYTQGKNSSDSAMIIDAMDILYTEKTDGFVIVSSDSDFTRLAIRLREAGQMVIGIGERKTPSAFIAACDKFTYIEVITKKVVPAAPKQKSNIQSTAVVQSTEPDQPPQNSQASQNSPAKTAPAAPTNEPKPEISKTSDEIIELITDSISDLAGDNGSVYMGDLGNLLIKKKPDFDPRNFGYKNLSTMIKSIARFEIEFRQTTDPNIKHVYVRDKEA